ncbi:hypothetical protein JS531_01190 [Bifidobacterium sp. CP2]|uniref:SCO7613 C-terminal domain-containing membrane protein n=1 Tax=Bifidobacterium sp. CP2 TaxID=2809025 RepID=UPI001BDC179F|nr:hypothetical protein [Bifidobacterium sp. CP2]MBT1180612.1 hypothetical protein [Bifidobacterium sp. CP2]
MQTLLLVLGVALVVLAVIAFGWFAYGLLGDFGRAVCIGVVGAAALAAGVPLARRLRVTAEGLSWAGLLALSASAFLFGDVSPIPAAAGGDRLLSGILLAVLAFVALGLRLVPHGEDVPPLRAYALFVTPALPLSVMMMLYALPVRGGETLVSLELTGGALTAVALAFLLPSDPRSRHADFEWLCAAIVAMVLSAPASLLLYPGMDYGDPLWFALCPLPLVLAVWLLLLTVLHVRRGSAGRPVAHGLRVPPVIGLVVAAASVSVPLLRVLRPMLGEDWGRAWANLATVLVAAIAVGVGCLTSDRVTVVSAPERVAATLSGSALATIMVCSEFSRFDGPSLLPSLTAYGALAAGAAGAWMLAARPVEKTVVLRPAPPHGPMAPGGPMPSGGPMPPLGSVPAPASAPGYAGPMPEPPMGGPAPVSQVMPAPAYSAAPMLTPQPEPMPLAAPVPAECTATVTAAKGMDANGIIAVAFAVIATAYLFLSTLFTPHPYVSIDLIIDIVGVAALLVGLRWMMLWPALRSAPALAPGLVLLTAPSLLISWRGTPSFLRMFALFAIAVGMVLLGAIGRLQFPLVYGSVVLVVHVVTVLWPWISAFSRDFWWVWLLIAGVLLIATAARYEASLKSMRTLASRIGDLR